jgi:DNA-binding transcriptional LysR family regulator/tRNA A-37 threonylcarbamoyl transferase component Bud32
MLPDDSGAAPPVAKAPPARGPETLGDGNAPTLPSSTPAASGNEPDPLLNARVGDYVITERLGAGGTGLVYAAIQPQIGKAVAIKVLRPEVARDPQQDQRLITEASLLARLRHRGIVDIFTLGKLEDGRHFLVMELLHGESLLDLIRRRGRLPAREALELFDEMLSALDAAHQAGLVHRDLKPNNVFVATDSSGSSFLKLLDFGLAKESPTPMGVTPQTQGQMFVGTPGYVAPEQARAGPVGPFTDLYSAGVVLFEMLTGQLPFRATTPIEVVMQHLEASPPVPSSLAPGIPPALDGLVGRLLAKDPAARPTSASEARAEVDAILAEVEAEPPEAARPSEGAPRAFTLRVGTRFELGLSWLTPALRPLRLRCPERTLHLAFGDSAELLRLLRNGELDGAVTSARLRGEWLRRVELHAEEYALVAAPALADATARVEAGELALADVHGDLPLFRYLLDAHPPARRWRFARTEVLGTIAAVRYRVLEGEAVAVLPRYFVEEQLREGALVRLLPDVPLPIDHFRLVWREGHPRDADLRRLAQELQAIPLR